MRHAACATSEVPEGSAHRVELDGIAVAVVHTQGQWFAIDDVCSHADVSLSEGEVDGCTLECWLHGSRFDLRTGQPSGPPATRPVPVYPVSVEDDTVFVTLT
jgi:3-phenylpropionate/trans-cinnamate dioxygenase ferredoxin component